MEYYIAMKTNKPQLYALIRMDVPNMLTKGSQTQNYMICYKSIQKKKVILYMT